MKVSDLVQLKIDRLPDEYLVTYKDFTPEVSNKEAVVKYLNRLANAGRIEKLSNASIANRKLLPLAPWNLPLRK